MNKQQQHIHIIKHVYDVVILDAFVNIYIKVETCTYTKRQVRVLREPVKLRDWGRDTRPKAIPHADEFAGITPTSARPTPQLANWG